MAYGGINRGWKGIGIEGMIISISADYLNMPTTLNLLGGAKSDKFPIQLLQVHPHLPSLIRSYFATGW